MFLGPASIVLLIRLFRPPGCMAAETNSSEVTGRLMWSGWDGVGTAAVTLVGPIAYFTRVFQECIGTSL